ncbi:MAG: lipoprotein signal peptidase [Gammaproteobacteria bacterium]|nr:lipoprotein signal peptidase [Gammaproteobacteria bacterium]
MKWLWLSLLVVIIDQATKLLASHYLQIQDPVAVFPGINLTLMHNTGAAFSILSQAGGWQRWFFIGLAVTVGIAIVVWLINLPADKRWMACALALVLGGALGNLWDRMTLSYVIDFIDVYFQNWHWPAFNIADSAISIGAVMLVIDAFWFGEAKVSV